jgi:hypothetical protein
MRSRLGHAITGPLMGAGSHDGSTTEGVDRIHDLLITGGHKNIVQS